MKGCFIDIGRLVDQSSSSFLLKDISRLLKRQQYIMQQGKQKEGNMLSRQTNKMKITALKKKSENIQEGMVSIKEESSITR